MREELREKYRDLLVGFEKFSFTEEQILAAIGEFDLALSDLRTCEACDGDICKTVNNHRCKHLYWHTLGPGKCDEKCYPQRGQMFYALYKSACASYKMPIFAMFECPGVAERKEELLNRFRAVGR